MIPMEGAPLWAPARGMTVVLRVDSAHTERLTGAIRGAMNELDPSVPLGTIECSSGPGARSDRLDGQLHSSVARRTFRQ
jgi:hypothetical protein